MPYKVIQDSDSPCVRLDLSGEISRKDHAALIRELRALPSAQSASLLLTFVDFQGLSLGAVEEENRETDEAIDRFERVAVVGDAGDEKAIATMLEPFASADVQFFDHSHADDAQSWLLA